MTDGKTWTKPGVTEKARGPIKRPAPLTRPRLLEGEWAFNRPDVSNTPEPLKQDRVLSINQWFSKQERSRYMYSGLPMARRALNESRRPLEQERLSKRNRVLCNIGAY